jgi:hypothetical protein
LKRFALALLAATALPAGAAMARNNPAPPPSGEVIHLFGPDSVFNNIIPNTESSAAAPAAKAAAAPANAPAATPSSTKAGTPASASSGGGWGDVLHQMFVTGDPNVPASERLSKGRTGGQ